MVEATVEGGGGVGRGAGARGSCHPGAVQLHLRVVAAGGQGVLLGPVHPQTAGCILHD